MSTDTEYIVGLDIGTTKIVILVGRKNEFGKIEVVGVGKAESEGVSRGVVSNIDKTIRSILKAKNEAEKASEIDIRIVNVGIAGQHIKSYQHRGSKTRDNVEEIIQQEDIDSLIDNMYKLPMAPGEKIIHVLPQEYIVDGEPDTDDPRGMLGTQLEANFHVITAQVGATKNIVRCVQSAGTDINELILEPLASATSVLDIKEKLAGVALVDIGGGTTDIAVFQDNIIRHTAVIPMGGNIITSDIMDGCGIIKEYAEKLKLNFGSAISTEVMARKMITVPGLMGRNAKEISMKNLALIIQSRMEEILEYVDHIIESSGFKHKLSAGIVLTGGGALLKNVRQLSEYVTGMETRLGYPNQHISGGIIDRVKSPVYSTGIGLMMMGFDNVEELPKKHSSVKGHSSIKMGGFFEMIKKKSHEFFNDKDTKLED